MFFTKLNWLNKTKFFYERIVRSLFFMDCFPVRNKRLD